MHGGLCARLAVTSWVSGSVNSLVQTTITFQLPMCTNKYIDHISCEILAVVRLACVDTSSNEVAIMVSSIVLLMTPFCLLLLSYIRIISTILKIQSTEGRKKAFRTCASHLTVVVLSYGMAIFTYIQPNSSPSVLQEKLMSLFYAILTPMLNPMIYSLRNKERPMGRENQTWMSEFILLGLSSLWETQVSLFVLFLAMYLVTVLGNFLLILLIRLDSRLNTPMYFFLSVLSCVDVCYTNSTVPQMLVHFLSARKSIPFYSCVLQLLISLAMGSTEFFLLGAMACDRYVAVCHPLHYTIIMHRELCLGLAAGCLVAGFMNSLMQTIITFRLPFCRRVVNHFAREMLAMLRLTCVDNSFNKVMVAVSGFLWLEGQISTSQLHNWVPLHSSSTDNIKQSLDDDLAETFRENFKFKWSQ
ncbi:hypothetical protein AB1E18_002962 [Capra hircus]